MGNYRQHLTFASVLGVVYAGAANVVAGIHWLYCTVAILLATMSGLLPDLDSDSGVEMKGFTGILGVLVAVAVWQKMGHTNPPPAFEYHLWAVVVAYAMVRHGLRRIAGKLTVHRGISHSLPTCAVWGELTYLYYPSESHFLRLVMATAVVVGFFSHLLLDEICSVDLRGVRLNKAFGTAMKFWAPNPWTTIAMYGLLSYLSYRVLQKWPEQPFALDSPAQPPFPISIPDTLHQLRQDITAWMPQGKMTR